MASRLVDLYNLCERFKQLPDAGGMLNQDPDIMDAFMVIGREVDLWMEAERKRKG